MSTISQPKVTFNIVGAQTVVENAPQKVLFVGQKTTTGTATSGQLYTEIDNSGQENTLFGQDSMLASAIRDFKKINKVSRVDVIPLADAGGVAAEGGVVFTGSTATANGTFTVTVGSRANHEYEVPVSFGDNITTIGDALEALINADTNSLITAVNTGGTVVLTATNKGEVGNYTAVQVEGSVAGITVALSQPAGGTVNPTLTGVFDVVGDIRYQTVVWPGVYDTTEVKTFLENRFNVTNNVLDGVAIMSRTSTFANLKVLGAALNSRNIVYFGNKAIIGDALYKGSALFEFNFNISAQFAAIRALRLTDNQSISQYVISTNGARDSFGGPHMASFPYHNTPFSLLPIIDIEKWFTREEQDELIDNGVSVLGNNITNTSIIANTIVTTYRTDVGGNPDISFKYLNYVDTISNIREYYYNNNKSAYSQFRLTAGDLIQGHNIANESSIRGYQTKLYTDLSESSFVLTQSGETALDFFKNNLVVELDISTGEVTINAQVPVVTQLREIIGTLQITFSTN